MLRTLLKTKDFEKGVNREPPEPAAHRGDAVIFSTRLHSGSLVSGVVQASTENDNFAGGSVSPGECPRSLELG